MLNNKLGKAILAAITFGLVMPAHAEDLKWHVGGGLANAVGTVAERGGVNLGLNLNGGFTYAFAEGGAKARPFVGLTFLGGKGKEGIDANNNLVAGSSIKSTLTNMQAGVDLVIPIGESNVSTVFGLTVGKFNFNTSGARKGEYSSIGIDAGNVDPDSTARTGDANGSGSYPGVKLGYRLGLEYAVSGKLAVDVTLQQFQLGRRFSDATASMSVNPAWLQVGVKYTF